MHSIAALRIPPLVFLAAGVFSWHSARAMEPLVCPGGSPLGRFELTVVPQAGGTERDIQTVNRLMPGDQVFYRPVEIDSLEKKKVRMALLLVPSGGSKIVVFDPKPANEPANWTVPFRAQLASIVWGPEGLNKAKVSSLIGKNNELIGQLADYAAKTEQTQALIQAITQQQALDTGQNVDAAVAGFASQFPTVKLDRTQPTDAQLSILLHGVNPSLGAYDPLADNPQQQAAQTAGLAAAVAGLFFGNGIGLAATGGVALINLHNILFPGTEFVSALTQHSPPQVTGLCGARAARPPHTELAFLWALRIPDAPAPEISLKSTEHLALGVKSSIPIEVKARDWKLAARVQDWRLVPATASPDNAKPVSVPVKVNTTAKTIELDLENHKLQPGDWKLAANWDWDAIPISGDLVLHELPKFTSARLTPKSQDNLNTGAGVLDLELTGDDFEFVRNIEFKKQGDPFAQPQPLPFHLPKEPPAGPETSLKIRLDAKPLATGNYLFMIAQTDGKVHETPFKVLPSPPTISATPLVLNTGVETQTVTLHGTGLDRVEQISADDAQLDSPSTGTATERTITVKLDPDVKEGALLAVHLKVKDFEEPVDIPDAFLVAGPRPAITTVRESPQGNLGIALNPGEIAANSMVSFELNVLHAPAVSGINLSCDNSAAGVAPLKIKIGEAEEGMKLTQESADALFLSFRPESVGQTQCSVMAALITPRSGASLSRKLGTVVRLPRIDSFQLTADKAGDNTYYGVLEGQDLENISKVGWDAQTGTPVDGIPAPVAGSGNRESLRIAVPWPAPAPHAPLYVWLRGEDSGRLTSAQY